MKQAIIEIIREGWIKNLSVSEVIGNIILATGLHEEYAKEQFTEFVFIAKP